MNYLDTLHLLPLYGGDYGVRVFMKPHWDDVSPFVMLLEVFDCGLIPAYLGAVDWYVHKNAVTKFKAASLRTPSLRPLACAGQAVRSSSGTTACTPFEPA